MNKTLSKAVVSRSRLRNRYHKHHNIANRNAYKKHRNFCVPLFKKEKKNYYENFDINKFTENNSFWKAIKPLFTEIHLFHNNITLVEKEEIIPRDPDVAEILNTYFSNIVKGLDIEGYKVDTKTTLVVNYKNLFFFSKE